MFGLGKLDDVGISRAKLEKSVSKSTGCSKKAASNRIDAVIESGGSLKYCLDNGLFELKTGDLRRFFKGVMLRGYVEKISGSKSVKAIDVYKQMKRAKSEYQIPYSDFFKSDLFNADDERLNEIREWRLRRKRVFISKIAEALGISEEAAEAETLRIKKRFSLSPEKYYNRRFYLKTDEEIEDVLRANRKAREDAVSKIAAETGWSHEEVKRDMARCYARYGITKSGYSVLKCYELDDDVLPTYGNIRDSHILNKLYNKPSAEVILRLKPLFNKNFGEFLGRKFWSNRDTDLKGFLEFVDGLDEIFCKPIDGFQGRDVEIISLENQDLEGLYEELMAKPPMLFEEKAKQHHELAEFYDRCANTVRLFTILDNDEFFAFASFIRFGSNGSSVDNVANGGVGCGVDVETGKICTPAMNHEGEFLFEHPNSHKEFIGFQIPNWEKALEVAEKALRKNPDLNYIGWDLAIREDDVVIIEGNSLPALGTCQEFFSYSKIGIRPLYERFLQEGK